jgi:hypothetical protein|tara:strand:+ start:61 stop:771 length:711 start_codon:yes stop_codon:yes gene_type:complete
MKKALLINPAFRYIFEVFIIVFSVSISFYIQDILNEREKIELKNESLRGVLADLNEDLEGFTDASEYLLNRIKLGDEFLSGQVSNKSINNILLTYGFLGIDSNYKSLVSTGAIEYINNKSLVKELTSYYEIDYSLLNDISGQYKHFYYGMFEFMLANYPTESMNKLILTDNKIDFTNKPLELQYDKQSLLKLYKDSEFRSRVYSLKRIVIVYIGFYQQAFDRNKKLSSLIENELNN